MKLLRDNNTIYKEPNILKFGICIIYLALVLMLITSCSIGKPLVSGDYKYNVASNHEAGIIKYLGKGGDITLPADFGETPIYEIQADAFADCSSLTSVKTSGYLSYIDDSAFANCVNLESVTISSHVTVVLDHAFAGCKNLHTVYFEGNAPTSVGSGIFDGASPDFVIYYHEATNGWTNPWNGYKTATY